jgi:hypothetical protein
VELCRDLRSAHGEDAVIATDARASAGVSVLDVTDGRAVADGELFVVVGRGRG